MKRDDDLSVARRRLRASFTYCRAAYGKRILATVSQHLTAEFGDGFALHSLYRSIQFCDQFPDEPSVSALSTQLSWRHFMQHAREQAIQQQSRLMGEVATAEKNSIEAAPTRKRATRTTRKGRDA